MFPIAFMKGTTNVLFVREKEYGSYLIYQGHIHIHMPFNNRGSRDI